jgi:hypothetical protein
VVIDHKSYAGDKPEEYAKKHIAQLSAYKEAIELSTGEKVIGALLHMPVIGVIVSLDLSL